MKLIKKSLLLTSLTLMLFINLFTNSSFAATDQAASFMSLEVSDSNSLGLAASAIGATFAKLGYNIVTPAPFSVTDTKTPVLSYIQGNGNNYALNVICHGSGNSTISRMNLNTATNGADAIYPENITGNWHFVILNCCHSLEGPSFANAFKTTSAYSNRAILGWYNEVSYAALGEFWPYFYEKVTQMGLRDLALYAAGNCYYSTPIRFYGDNTWYGWAW